MGHYHWLLCYVRLSFLLFWLACVNAFYEHHDLCLCWNYLLPSSWICYGHGHGMICGYVRDCHSRIFGDILGLLCICSNVCVRSPLHHHTRCHHLFIPHLPRSFAYHVRHLDLTRCIVYEERIWIACDVMWGMIPAKSGTRRMWNVPYTSSIWETEPSYMVERRYKKYGLVFLYMKFWLEKRWHTLNVIKQRA